MDIILKMGLNILNNMKLYERFKFFKNHAFKLN
jgi:hypothetical protein